MVIFLDLLQKIIEKDKMLDYEFDILETIDLVLQVGGHIDYLYNLKFTH